MKITFLPKTHAGKYSVVLFTVFILLSMAGGLISSVQKNTIEYPTPINSPLLGTTIYLMFTAAIIASITGLIAVRKNNERSILVYISIPLGIAFFIGILMLLIGNIIGPPNQ
jgi:hypothetical protein